MSKTSVDNASGTDLVQFTDEAVNKIAEVLTEQEAEGSYLRIIANLAGGGVQYEFGLDAEPGDTDAVVKSGAVRALVDEDSAALLIGSRIDYVEGMQRSGFVISNPNFPAMGGCGCGGGGCGCGGGGSGSGHDEADPVDQQTTGGCGSGNCGCGEGDTGH